MRAFRHITMPLLGKELVEQAACKRTYIVRVVYALLLFAASAILLNQVLQSYGYDTWNLMGSGLQIAEPLVYFQFFGICLFLPAMLAGAISGEKERDSLALLFLTDMGPWEILLQKYLGRLIPMFSFLLLSLPLLAVAYALGGIESGFVFCAVWMLFLTCLQVGALTLLCSVIFRTTVGAFVAAYLSLAAFYLLPILLQNVWQVGLWELWEVEEFVLYLIPPYIYSKHQQDFLDLLPYSIPIMFSIMLLLLLARFLLVRRAFAPAKNILLSFFRRLDRTYKRWNDRLGGITLGRKEEDSLPDSDPVAWRELHKRSMGRLSYLVRLGLWIEIPLAFIGFLVICESSRDSGIFYLLYGAVWVLAVLFLTVQGANTIMAERTQQTLEVLLTTPIEGKEIVLQKMRMLHRLCMLFAIPLLTVAAIRSVQFVVHGYYYYRAGNTLWMYTISALLCVVVYLPLLAWFSMWIGLRVRTRAKAILVVLIALVGWCMAAPLTAFILTEVYQVMPSAPQIIFPGSLLLFSPATGVFATVIGWHAGPFVDWGILVMILNFVLYGAILFRLRYLCLRDADRLLRRE